MSDDVAQEIQIPIGLQAMSDVDELMHSRPATLRDPVSPDQIVVEYPQADVFSETTLVQKVSRGRDSST